MIPHYQVPRNTLLWLFASQLAVLLPHLTRTPAWVSALLLACMVWRVQVFRGRWNFPGKAVKVILTGLSAIGLVFSFPSFVGLEALVSVLFAAYALKLLEMYHKRDALVLLYLSFFLVMTSFLFSQEMLLALYNVFCVMVILTALSGLYQESGYRHMARSFRRAMILVLQAVPLMMLMFVALPRLPSFWNIPLNKGSPKTGMSDSMSPGDFSRLVQTSDPVMRITFHGEIPERREMYWRGLVFSRFDGRRWDALPFDNHPAISPQAPQRAQAQAKMQQKKLSAPMSTSTPAQQPTAAAGRQRTYIYDVILEESDQPWLFSMAQALSPTPGIILTSDFLLMKQGLVDSRFQYQVITYPDAILDPELFDDERGVETQLPEAHNPQARAIAVKWLQESGSPEAYINRVLAYYHDNFYYTLQPETVAGDDGIDEFLFETRKGFCEHFAGSFVFLMRAAGIPARVVVGYQGGEFNPYEHYLLVKQYDAHAWAEVWLAGKGWVRFDPTFAVAPQRILDGFRDSFEQRGETTLPLLSLDRYHNSTVLNLLRLQLDRLNYNWARWVLGFDNARQLELMEQLFGEYSVAKVAAYIVSASVLFLGILYGLLLWQERDRNPDRNPDPVIRAYRKFCRRMKRRGLAPQPGETPEHFLARLAAADPVRYGHLGSVAQQLYRYWYSKGSEPFNAEPFDVSLLS